MSFATYKQLIQRIVSDHKKSLSRPGHINIVFHGGEPTLLGKAEFQRFIDYAQEVLYSVSFSIQTNLTNIDNEWAALFVKNNIAVGISLDGINNKENELRKHGFSFKKALHVFQKYNITPGILSIISKNNYKQFPKTLKSILSYAQQPGDIRANYVEDTLHPALSEYEVSGKDLYTYAYKPLLKKALHTLVPPRESNLKSIINKFTDAFLTDASPAINNSNCYTKFCRGGNTIVEVEPTGEVNSCGRWDIIRDVSTVGHIAQPDPWGIYSLRIAIHLQALKIKDMYKKNCDVCPAAAICDYGCIAFSYIKHNGHVQVRKEISCDLYLQLQQLLMHNRYRVILLSAKQLKFKIKKSKTAYNIELPSKVIIKSSFADHNIQIKENPKQLIIARNKNLDYTDV